MPHDGLGKKVAAPGQEFVQLEHRAARRNPWMVENLMSCKLEEYKSRSQRLGGGEGVGSGCLDEKTIGQQFVAVWSFWLGLTHVPCRFSCSHLSSLLASLEIS